MSSFLRSLIVIAVVLGVGALAFRRARHRVLDGYRSRRTALVLHGITTGIGTFLTFVAPRMLPETQVSPASLVAVFVLWVIGGALMLLGLASFLGAFFARARVG